jgi:mRNA-degrading endonuclease RelE of RelBE toxin-antitoxin system
MRYKVDLKPRAMKDLRRVPRDQARRVPDALDEQIEAYEDLHALRAAKAKEFVAPTVSASEARRELRR